MFRNRVLGAVSLGHFWIDIMNSSAPVLLAALSVPLALSNSQVALALTLGTLSGALSQPLFGLLADRLPRRAMLLAGVGVIWMAALLAAAVLSGAWWLLVACYVAAVLGSGLYHPIGTNAASAAEPQRAGQNTALFFFAGQAGLASGPLLAGVLIQNFDSVGITAIAVLAIVPALLLFSTPALPVISKSRRATGSALQAAGMLAVLLIGAFIVLVALRSTIQNTYTAFLPKLFQERGFPPALYGLMSGAFMAAAAIGNVLSGMVADRFGMRSAILWPLLLGAPLGLAIVYAPSAPLALLACAVAGLVIGGQHSVLVVYAQRLLPTGGSFSAGLMLGFTFASGAIGTWLMGALADRIGLPVMLAGLTLLALPAALCALSLPTRVRIDVTPAAANPLPGESRSAAD